MAPENNNPKIPNPSSLHVEAAPAITREPTPLRKMMAVASIAAGIQFGWALQLSLLTPYVQLLGVPHKWAANIWLCGPISGMIIQPIVGYYSDRCTSRYGRRKPFILSGAIAVAIAVFLIGFAADIGHHLGDDISEKKTRPRAVVIFVTGFWILDVANNMLQGPCRAFIGDLAAGDHQKTRTGNALFSFFMAVGNVLGYAAGSFDKLNKMFPFAETKACDVFCANLKSCFFFSIALLIILSVFAVSYVKDIPITSLDEELKPDQQVSCLGELSGAFKGLKKPMWILMLVTAINWVAWFPFFLFDTDWMGREVYGGSTGNDVSDTLKNAYNKGVHTGALALMLHSVILGLMSLAVEPLGRYVGGAKRLWGIVNFILAIGLAMTVVITKAAQHDRHVRGLAAVGYPSTGVKAGAFIFFAVLGVPLAITFSVPFALASIYSSSSGAGQGLSLGVLNIAIVVPQMIVSAISGPWDSLFGGGNLPAFVVGAVAATVSAVLALVLLPTPKPADVAKASSAISGGFH